MSCPLASNGQESILYQLLEQKYGSTLAPIYWAQVRSQQFLNKYGDWTRQDVWGFKKVKIPLDANGEPTLEAVESRLRLTQGSMELKAGMFANPEQEDAVNKITDFLADESPETGQPDLYLLEGGAGTGKTTSINAALENFQGNIVGATVSAEAQGILQQNMVGKKTMTIAKLLGLVPDKTAGEKIKFRRRNAAEEVKFRKMGKTDPIEDADLVIIDEASMVDDGTWQMLLDLKPDLAKIIFLGDPTQIPPIGEKTSKVFSIMQKTANHSKLTQVMRFQESAPIFKITERMFADNIRAQQATGKLPVANPLAGRVLEDEAANGEGVLYRSNHEGLVKDMAEEFRRNKGLKDVVIIADRNEEVARINAAIRQELYGDSASEIFKVGERIRMADVFAPNDQMVAENNLKGIIREKRESQINGIPVLNLTVEFERVNIRGEIETKLTSIPALPPASRIAFNAEAARLKQAALAGGGGRAWGPYYEFTKAFAMVDYTYAMTAHKVQGSTYKTVYALEYDIYRANNPRDIVETNQLMRTATSRPTTKLVVVTARSRNTNSTLVDDVILKTKGKPVAPVPAEKKGKPAENTKLPPLPPIKPPVAEEGEPKIYKEFGTQYRFESKDGKVTGEYRQGEKGKWKALTDAKAQEKFEKFAGGQEDSTAIPQEVIDAVLLKKPIPQKYRDKGTTVQGSPIRTKVPGRTSGQMIRLGERTETTRSAGQFIKPTKGELEIHEDENGKMLVRVTTTPYAPNKEDFDKYEGWMEGTWEQSQHHFTDKWYSYQFEYLGDIVNGKLVPKQLPAPNGSQEPPLRGTEVSGGVIEVPPAEVQMPKVLNVWHGPKAETGENTEFSNLYGRPFTYEGRPYISVEHAYQSNKGGEFDEETYKKYKVPGKKIPGKLAAKVEGGANLALMKTLVLESFKENPEAAKALVATENAVFKHTQDKGIWADEFPRILTEVRKELGVPAGPPTTLSPADFTNHSGGAEGSDAAWDIIGNKHGFPVHNHYLLSEDPEVADAGLKTKGVKPVVVTSSDQIEGQQKVTLAARKMGRIEHNHQVRNTKLIRNWSQVKYADAIFAVGTIVEPGSVIEHGKRAANWQVKGGTGYAVQMAIDAGKPVYVFDQNKKHWFKYKNGEFFVTETPILTKNFAGIGTRQLNIAGEKAIDDVYQNTKKNMAKVITTPIAPTGTGAPEFLDLESDKALGKLPNLRLEEAAMTARIRAMYDIALANPTKVYHVPYDQKNDAFAVGNTEYNARELANLFDSMEIPANVQFTPRMQGLIRNSSRRILKEFVQTMDTPLIERNAEMIRKTADQLLIPRLNEKGEAVGHFTPGEQEAIVNGLMALTERLYRKDPGLKGNAVVRAF